MAGKIPVYTSQVSAAAMPDAGPPVYLNVQDFAKNSDGAMLREVGQGLASLGNSVADSGKKMWEQKVATDLLASKVNIQEAMDLFDNDYRKNNKGISARNAAEDYANFLKEKIAAESEKWEGNNYALKGLASIEAGFKPSFIARGIDYRDQQEQEYLNTQMEADYQQTLAKWSDPSLSYEEKQRAFANLETNMRYFSGQMLTTNADGQKVWSGGKNIDGKLAEAKRQGHLGHVEGMISAGRLAEAKEYSLAHSQDLGGRSGVLAQQIDGLMAEAAKRAEYDRRQAAVLKAQEEFFGLKPQQAEKELANAKVRAKLGLSEKDAAQVMQLMHTYENYAQAVERAKRKEQEREQLVEVLNLAVGVSGKPQNPVAAQQALAQSSLSEPIRQEIHTALENGLVNQKDDPVFVRHLTSRMLQSDSPLEEQEYLLAVANGKMTLATHKKLELLQEQTQGACGPMIRDGYKALDAVMCQNMPLCNTPEQAVARQKAQDHLQLLVDINSKSINPQALEDILQPDYIRKIAECYTLDMREQGLSVLKQTMSLAAESANNSERQPGESVDDFLKRSGSQPS